MKYIKDITEITKHDLEKINSSLVLFNDYLESITRKATNENIGLYEHWIDCMYDIQSIITAKND